MYGASITAFLTAVLICAFHEVIPARRQKKPVAVAIPVNLRNYFESESARNFFGVFTVSYTFHKQSDRLEDVIASVAASFKRELTAENLSRRMNALLALEHNPLVRILPPGGAAVGAFFGARRKNVAFQHWAGYNAARADAVYLPV